MAGGRPAGARPDWGAPSPGPTRRPAAPARGARPAPAGRRPAPSRGRRPGPSGSTFRARYAVVHDLEGPKVRLGVLWFLTALVALVGGPVPAAVVYGGVAAAAAAQAARAWVPHGGRPSDVMAGAGALAMALGAVLGAGGAGLGVLVAVGLAFAGAAGGPSPNPRIADIGTTLQCALAPGAAALSVVLIARYDQGSAISLLLLVSAFEVGDFLIGTSAKNPYEGPGAGAAAIVVLTFIVSTLPVTTLSFGEAWALGGATVLLGPLGQFLASWVLPAAAAPAPALRRLDTLLLAAPVWAWAVGMAIST